MKKRRAPQHSDCDHVPSLPKAQHSPSYIGAGGDGVANGAKCSCPEDLWRKVLKSHSKVKEKIGGECNCEGDERHPRGCKGVRIGL